jgi:chemotaxis protein CheX
MANGNGRELDATMVNPFLAAAGEVFRQMFNCELVKGQVRIKKDPSASDEVAIIIGITGDTHTGVVVLGMKSYTAKKLTSFLDSTITNEKDKAFSDALGEVANIISGNAMAVFTAQELILNITTPTVIVGEAFEIHLLDQTTLSTEMQSPFGMLEINVAIKKIQ